MLFEPKLDLRKLPALDLRRQQFLLLKESLSFIQKKSLFYKKQWKKKGVSLSSIKELRDLELLPFTTKEDIQKNNWDFLAIPKNKCLEIVATTGTTGEPIFFGLSRSDLVRLAENEKRCFLLCGLKPGDLVQIAVSMDNLFIAGMAYYSGLLRLGARVIRTGLHQSCRQLSLMKLLNPKAIVTVPSFMVMLSKEAQDAGLAPGQLGLEKAILIGESIRNNDFTSNFLGRRIEQGWKAECFSTYGITEATVSFCECRLHQGNHGHPEMAIAEIVDDKGNSLPDGEAGELVLTTLQAEAMPLVRYKTGDITFGLSAACKCGHTCPRIGPIIGRKSQRLKVKGTTVYPKAIENALLDINDVVNYIIEAYNEDDSTDKVLVKVGIKKYSQGIIKKLKERLLGALRFTPEIELLHSQEIERLQYQGGRRKALTFIDKRKTNRQ